MDVIGFLIEAGGWAWVVAGLVLLALELVLPGGILLWLGISGIITGLAALFQPISLPFQALIFGMLSLVTIFGWLRYAKTRQTVSDRPYLNRRGDRLVGHEAVLDEPITGGYGRVALGDTVWRIAGPDLAAGKRVRIVAAEGAVLKVEPV
ncbi:NfeD family protein [Arsenicitalea aurantiaca]|uniref:NfeD family protein n=1 Tax=Arsenicitalea aurantiaca TaxID=1783274 RepID=A0A433XK65_9HYPH|nr:NfeD family protein [Arsenicitalea aurantiaca]RUT34459.1 NfeD family protein [Arsenicitalea aurantiaca]